MPIPESGSSQTILSASAHDRDSLRSLSEERVVHVARVKAESSNVSVREEIESCVRDAVEEALAEHRQKKAAPSPLLKRDEAAEILSISLRHLDTLVATGEITPVRIGRSVRFRPEAIREFIEASAREK